MKLKSFKVENYKSFRSGSKIELSESISLIIGKNNSGKTALIELLRPFVEHDRPYLNAKVPYGQQNPRSTAIIEFELSSQEVVAIILTTRDEAGIPLRRSHDINSASSYVKQFSENIFSLNVVVSRNRNDFDVKSVSFDGQPGPYSCIYVRPTSDNSDLIALYPQDSLNGFIILMPTVIQKSIYFFEAERLAIGASPITPETDLSPNAGNLAAVLHNFLVGNRKRSNEYRDTVKSIINNIDDITIEVVNLPSNTNGTPFPNALIKIWLSGSDEDRKDLGFDLKDCGTGVGQVLSIFYIIISSTYPKNIIIDEPNSFLNPGAVRSLISIMNKYNQHSYIMTTHSSEIISACRNPSLTLVKWHNGESGTETMEQSDLRSSREILQELGVRVSDVFGSDFIVWVEGPTEAKCFPIIVEFESISVQPGTKFIPVVGTTEIARTTQKAKTLVGIYEALCTANALIPPSIAISLDREQFHDEQVAELERNLGYKVSFLGRRCIENYFLSIDVICHQLIRVGYDAPIADLVSQVEEWFAQLKSRPRFSTLHNWNGDLLDDNWLKKVDGANILGSIFSDVTNSKYNFLKTTHTPEMLEWSLINRRIDIIEIIEYVRRLFISQPT